MQYVHIADTFIFADMDTYVSYVRRKQKAKHRQKSSTCAALYFVSCKSKGKKERNDGAAGRHTHTRSIAHVAHKASEGGYQQTPNAEPPASTGNSRVARDHSGSFRGIVDRGAARLWG